MGSGGSKQSQESEDQRTVLGGSKLIRLTWAEHLGLRSPRDHTFALTRSSLVLSLTYFFLVTKK